MISVQAFFHEGREVLLLKSLRLLKPRCLEISPDKVYGFLQHFLRLFCSQQARMVFLRQEGHNPPIPGEGGRNPPMDPGHL